MKGVYLVDALFLPLLNLAVQRFAKDKATIDAQCGYVSIPQARQPSKLRLRAGVTVHIGVGFSVARTDKSGLPTEKLSIADGKAGCGTLCYRPDRVLTKTRMSWGRWDLPQFFKNVSITHHPDPWREGYFQSAGRGQEFIMDGTPNIEEWAKSIIM